MHIVSACRSNLHAHDGLEMSARGPSIRFNRTAVDSLKLCTSLSVASPFPAHRTLQLASIRKIKPMIWFSMPSGSKICNPTSAKCLERARREGGSRRYRTILLGRGGR